MRKTLHVLPVRLARAATAATAHYRLRDTYRLLSNAGVPMRTAEQTIDHLVAFLRATGTATHRQIEAHLTGRGSSTVVARLSLKLAWERGDISYENRSTVWNQELRTFRWRPPERPMSRSDATRELLTAYFGVYGPATVRDASWWSGLPQSAVVGTLEELTVTALRLPWATAPFYLPSDRYEQSLRADVPTDCVNLLAHEDVVLKAYHQSRSRYLGDLPQRTVFNAIGEVSPVVLVGGRVVGLWTWDGSAETVRVHGIRDSGPELRAPAVERRQRMLARSLALGWSDRRRPRL